MTNFTSLKLNKCVGITKKHIPVQYKQRKNDRNDENY